MYDKCRVTIDRLPIVPQLLGPGFEPRMKDLITISVVVPLVIFVV